MGILPRAETPEKLASGEQESIAQWLMRGPAQLASGPHAGAVAGVVDVHGRGCYAYPEITGYFLQWLAWRAARCGFSSELARRGAAAQQWLARWLEDRDPPRTRIDLGEATDDWRNRAVFCFDLAMVLRGVASAARLQLIVPDAAVIAGVTRQLHRLVGADGIFDACVPDDDKIPLPRRWSTSRGAFLAKAAAGILTASASLRGLDDTVRQSAAATFVASLRWAVESPHDDVHALLSRSKVSSVFRNIRNSRRSFRNWPRNSIRCSPTHVSSAMCPSRAGIRRQALDREGLTSWRRPFA